MIGIRTFSFFVPAVLLLIVAFQEEPTGYSPVFGSMIALSIASIVFYYMLINIEKKYPFKKSAYFEAFPITPKEFVIKETASILRKPDFALLLVVNVFCLYLTSLAGKGLDVALFAVLYILNAALVIFFCSLLKVTVTANSHLARYSFLIIVLALGDIFNLDIAGPFVNTLFYTPLVTLFFSPFLSDHNILITLLVSAIFLGGLYALFNSGTRYWRS